MATVWAKSNGNWSATTLWAFWNETTQQIEDYGQVPQSGDMVYCNGYTITLNITTIDIGDGVLSNGITPHTNIGGGNFLQSSLAYNNIIGNLEAYASNLLSISAVNANHAFHINGNILSYLSNGQVLSFNKINTQGEDLIINGNITGAYIANLFVYGTAITVNGNVDCNGVLATSSSSTSYSRTFIININGNITSRCNIVAHSGTTDVNFNVNGDSNMVSTNIGVINLNVKNIRNTYGVPIETNNLTIDGGIYYTSFNPYQWSIGVNFSNITIQNPDTFIWKDITEPRVNPFIIVTDAEMNNRQQYPPEDEVKQGTEYVWGEKVGKYLPDYPPESVVLKDYEYGDSDARKTGTMVQEVNVEVGCVTKEDVREGVALIGMGEVGTLVVPSVDDVREGVVFDNGSVGTLIVQGGGDRLRIADFGYYTNAQSDTYIVDLTEQDKPKFAVAEERVLIEMFPDLDLDNIPDKYFDDLFVKYLKYRLIVEYYRTAGINSTFTPSEPTTEIVNYQNVRNEVWLNSANIYLKAWAKKYPESIVKPQRILL